MAAVQSLVIAASASFTNFVFLLNCFGYYCSARLYLLVEYNKLHCVVYNSCKMTPSLTPAAAIVASVHNVG